MTGSGKSGGWLLSGEVGQPTARRRRGRGVGGVGSRVGGRA